MQVQIANLGKYEGAYRVAAVSGLITGLTAGDQIFAMQWKPPTSPAAETNVKFAVLQRLRVKWRTVASPTAAQEVGIDAFYARTFPTKGSGGTAVVFTGGAQAKRTNTAPAAGVTGSGLPSSLVADMRIATTTALTPGAAQVLDAAPFASERYADLAAAATVGKGRTEAEFLNADVCGYPIVMSPSEGIVVTVAVTMGTALTARVIVEVDWLEVARC